MDENQIQYPSIGTESIRKCPRRVGIRSTGLIVSGSELEVGTLPDWRPAGQTLPSSCSATRCTAYTEPPQQVTPCSPDPDWISQNLTLLTLAQRIWS
ncbi:MAG TPA: hypothetical protein DDY14_12840 [Chromatiaceae bacterium]|nr:hypothetical protein [Chromatiaceae bacterium]HCS90316.1 hypothetical protein [Chromatiaceae bacterium]